MLQKWIKSSLALLCAVVFLLCAAAPAMASTMHEVTVGENAKLEVQLMDSSGLTLSPGKPIDTISYIVKSKPEGAKVSAQTSDDSELENSGKLTIAFRCDKEGTVELQTFIRVKDSSKFYTGDYTIQVVADATKASKIVIMSVGSQQIIVNNDVVKSDAAPVIHNSRTYVPLRVLSDIFEAQCSYDNNTHQVTVTKGDNTIVMTIGADTYMLNGTSAVLDAPVYISQDRTMVPIRLIAETFGVVVKPTYAENGSVADIMFQM